MTAQVSGDSVEFEQWAAQLDSIRDGDSAVERLISKGDRAVPYLEQFLFGGRARTVAQPRCRAVRALGELGACSTLTSYLRDRLLPIDAEVLFAEDAVRSAAARELLRWRSDEVFQTLSEAAAIRSTSGLLFAIGEFRRHSAVPLLFRNLEDDLCRDEAKDALRKVPDPARQFAILLIRGKADMPFYDSSARYRRRATLQLLNEFGISAQDWQDLQRFLAEDDADMVIACAQIGFRVAGAATMERIIESLFRVSAHSNWAQEEEIELLLDKTPELARLMARARADELYFAGLRPNWLDPSWRILWHVLGREIKSRHGWNIAPCSRL